MGETVETRGNGLGGPIIVCALDVINQTRIVGALLAKAGRGASAIAGRLNALDSDGSAEIFRTTHLRFVVNVEGTSVHPV